MPETDTGPVPPGAVVVGIDGSPTADLALTWAATYADRDGRPLVVVHGLGAFSAPEAAGLTFDGGASFTLVYEHLHREGEALVHAALQRVATSHPSVPSTPVVEHRDARQLLLELADEAALVVVGSRGHGPFRSLLLGSVAAGVAGRARCPVVVIPGQDEEAAS